MHVENYFLKIKKKIPLHSLSVFCLYFDLFETKTKGCLVFVLNECKPFKILF